MLISEIKLLVNIYIYVSFFLPDSVETTKAKVTVEMSHSSVKLRAAAQLPVIGPDDDLTSILLQVHITFHLSVKCYLSVTSLLLFLFCKHCQIFPVKVDHRWHASPASQFSLALQQALAKELMRAKQGQVQNGGLAFQLLQAITALLTSAHAGPIVMSMHRSHALSCPLMRQLHLYQARRVR